MVARNSKNEVIWKCSVRGCKNKDNLCIDPDKVHNFFKPKKYTILCEEHKIIWQDEYRGYVMTIEARGCGCCAINKLYSPNNPKPIREGQIDLKMTAAILVRTWTSGIDTLIRMREEMPV